MVRKQYKQISNLVVTIFIFLTLFWFIVGGTNAYAESPLQEKWRYNLTRGGFWVIDPSPAIFPYMAVFGTNELLDTGPEGTRQGRYIALDDYGQVLWFGNTPDDWTQASPAIVWLSGDPQIGEEFRPQVVGASCSGKWVLAYDGRDGSLLWQFGPHSEFKASPAVAEVRPDYAGLETIIANQNMEYTDVGGKVFCISSEGVGIWEFPSENSHKIFTATPAIADVDNDDELEVIAISDDGSVYCLRAYDGAPKWTFEVSEYESPGRFTIAGGEIFGHECLVISSPAIANIDDDPYKEIIFGTASGGLYCLTGADGSDKWFFQTGEPIASSPAVGDVDGDGYLEIVFGSKDTMVYCLNRTGGIIWTYDTDGPVNGSPSLVNRKNDATHGMEWPMFRNNHTRTGFYNDGCSEESMYGWGCEPLTSGLDVYIGSDDGYLYLLYGKTGELITRFKADAPVNCSPAIGDIDGDGILEVLFKDTDVTIYALEDYGGGYPDNTPPEVTCPGDMIFLATGDETEVTYLALATATDDFDPAPTIIYSPPSGSLLPRGNTTVTVTATDQSGNTSTCTFTVTVRDPVTITIGPEDSIQTMIDSAVNGDTLILKEGTYNESINYGGKTITIQSTNPDDPEVVAKTIMGGGTGSIVTFSNEESRDSVLSGVTIQNGNAPTGGGVYCSGASPTITHCIIRGNVASESGGGISIDKGCTPRITNCTITANSAKSGGGVYCSNAGIIVEDSTISWNHANSGGGISYTRFNLMAIEISNCIITHNSAARYGGGIIQYTSKSRITNCIISENTATSGGGICYYSCYTYGNPSTLANCILSKNKALHTDPNKYPGQDNGLGGGIYCKNARPRIINCTIADNEARDETVDDASEFNRGGGLHCANPVSYFPIITNSIVWGNAPSQLFVEAGQIESTDLVTYSDVQHETGVYPGQGNINADPLFINASSGDYGLHADSPCVDAGTIPECDFYFIFPHEDKDGRPRIIDGNQDGEPVCDMGAYEYEPFIIELPVAAGWSMISLPVHPSNATASVILPEAIVIYGYEKNGGYIRVKGDDELKVGQGYWILMDEAKTYTLTGQPVQEYSCTINEDEWHMIGACSFPASASITNGTIGIMYGYDQDCGYKRLETVTLEPGKGYWILTNNVVDQATLTVKNR